MRRHRDSFTATAVFDHRSDMKLVVPATMGKRDMLMLVPIELQSQLIGIKAPNGKWID